uniref:G domain-containing protein n=1 Tax=Acrobeloides nanus TaxID=290746 RepID=A0A914DCN2_9BILA
MNLVEIKEEDEKASFKLISDNNFEQKVEFMEIKDELSSIMGGLIKPLGYGLFLIEEKKSERQVSFTLLYIHETETHTLLLSNSIIATNNVIHTKATHYVSAIKMGIAIPITITATISNDIPEDHMLSRLEDFARLLKKGLTGDVLIPTDVLTKIKTKFIETNSLLAKVNDMDQDLIEFSPFFNEEAAESLRESVLQFNEEISLLKRDLGDVIKIYHKTGQCREKSFDSVLNKYEVLINRMNAILNVDWLPWKIKINCLYKWNEHDKFVYVGSTDDYLGYITKLPECFVLFATWSEIDITDDGELKQFDDLLKKGHYCIFVDQDVQTGKYPGEIRLCHYKNGKLFDADILNRYIQKVQAGIARYDKKMANDEIPKNAVQLEIRCPNSYKKEGCETKNHFWYCEECNKIYFYLKNYLYCECGKALARNFVFRCNDMLHGAKFCPFEHKILEDIIKDIQSKKDIYILVLGRSGVGKTTWLNAFANYLTFPTLEKSRKANASNPTYLVPAAFTVGEYRVYVGKDSESENLSDSQAATKFPRSIIFETRDKRIHFIDTPGLSDTAGNEQDIKNINNTLHFLSENNVELHAICVLWTPEIQKRTEFKYTINEYLSHLHRNSVKNILFCYTHARYDEFKPDTTILQEHLDKISENSSLFDPVKILLNHENVYAMDNEAIRYIYSQQEKKIKFNEQEITWFDNSWNHSQREIARLIDHVSKLEPHKTDDMIALSMAKKAMEPLCYVLSTILSVIKQLNSKKVELERLDGLETNLVEQLTVPKLEIKMGKVEFTFSGSKKREVDEPDVAISEMKQQLDEIIAVFEKEKNEIKESLTKLGSFIKTYALIPYNKISEVSKNKPEPNDKGNSIGINNNIITILNTCVYIKDALTKESVDKIMKNMFALERSGEVIEELYNLYLARMYEETFLLKPEKIFAPNHDDIEEFNEDIQSDAAVFTQHTMAPRTVPFNLEPIRNREKNNDWSKYTLDKFWWCKGKNLLKNVKKDTEQKPKTLLNQTQEIDGESSDQDESTSEASSASKQQIETDSVLDELKEFLKFKELMKKKKRGSDSNTKN